MKLLEIISRKFHNSRNIHEKMKIEPILQKIRENGFTNSQIYASYGEDSAAIRISDKTEDLILLTTDALLPEFLEKSPYGAGYSAIYLGVEDIVVSGGQPLACSVTLAYNKKELGEKIINGLIAATNLFQIPLIRGHTVTDAKISALSIAMIGRTTIPKYLSICGSKAGNYIGLVWDIEGKPAKVNKQYWDTISESSTESFYYKREFISESITNKYITACKDISNGGILGTIYQILQYNQCGANLDLDQMETDLKSDNFLYSLVDFLFLFLTSGFIITGEILKRPQLEAIVKKKGLKFYHLGILTENLDYKISHNKQVLRLL